MCTLHTTTLNCVVRIQHASSETLFLLFCSHGVALQHKFFTFQTPLLVLDTNWPLNTATKLVFRKEGQK